MGRAARRAPGRAAGDAAAGDVAAALRPPYAVLQAPAAVAYKLWPLAHWRALVAALLERGLQVVLTGAPSAGDRALVAAVAERPFDAIACSTSPDGST